MPHGLTEKARNSWIALVEREGAALGLADCRPFLEGKYVNDIFFDGLFSGRPCIVKCSSKAPDSIANEYEMNRRLHEADPGVFPEPLAVHCGPMAFVVTEKLSPADRLSAPVDDIMRMVHALETTGIVHRDVQLNLLAGSDGHLRLIDFQFAIDRNAYRESQFMESHWKYHYTVFGVHRQLGIGRWNDVTSFIAVLERNQYDGWEGAVAELRRIEAQMEYSARFTKLEKTRFLVYAASLWLQSRLGWDSRKRAITAERLSVVMTAFGGGRACSGGEV